MKKPTTKQLRDLADRLWSKAVLVDWNHKCAVCKSTSNLNAHHLVPRQQYNTRFDLENGYCLCSYCHQFCPKQSPHQNAAGWMAWLEGHDPARATWYSLAVAEQHHRDALVTKNHQYYVDHIARLRQYLEDEIYEEILRSARMVRFAEWLESQGESDDDCV